MPTELILYDLACKGRLACWSPNVARLVLNYKGIPYRTEWVTHPDIAPKLKQLSLPPNESGQGSPYTVPTIQMSDDPPLHLDNGLPQKVGPILGKAIGPLVPVFMPRIGRDIIAEESYDWFQEARGKRFGMPLDELEKAKGGDQAFEAASPGIKELANFLRKNKRNDGPFILGSEVCYADFLIASTMESLRRIGADMYEKIATVSGDDGLQNLHKACQKWMIEDQ